MTCRNENRNESRSGDGSVLCQRIDTDNVVVVGDTERERELLLPINTGQRIDANNDVVLLLLLLLLLLRILMVDEVPVAMPRRQ